MLNYEVDPAVLAGLVPAGTELDRWEGRTLASIVGFQFLDTRVLGVAVPWHRDFDEVNLRFYVRRVVGDEIRRGVVFVKEIVPRRAIAWIANALYDEKYVALPMSHRIDWSSSPRSVAYRWRYDDKPCHLQVTLDGDAYLASEISEEAFITEHYWGYTAQRDGSTLEYKVEHPRWNVWKGLEPELTCDIAALYGEKFAPFLDRPPRSCFVADGSAVVVRRGVRI